MTAIFMWAISIAIWQPYYTHPALSFFLSLWWLLHGFSFWNILILAFYFYEKKKKRRNIPKLSSQNPLSDLHMSP